MIKKPADMNFADKNIIMIVSGMPGVGKTTLALSAPDVLLIDADEGMARVNPKHRKDASIVKTYEDVLNDIKEAKGVYKTLVIDTAGALIELMKDWAMRSEPSARKKNGGFSLQGYGVIKSEFLRLSAELRKNFNVVFLFHETKDKVDEEVFWDIVCEGATKTLVWQPADLGAHMFIQGGERMLGFTPTSNYNAKSAYGIRGLVRVPDLKDGEPNTFLTSLFEQVKKNLAAENAEMAPKAAEYDEVMAKGKEALAALDSPDMAIPVLTAIRELPDVLTARKELEAAFKAIVKANGWKYDAASKQYV